MKNISRREFLMATAACAAAGTLTACGGSSSAPASTAGSTAGSTAASAAAGSYTDYSAGFPERITIKIPVYDRAFEGWNVTDNYYTKWVQSEFGDKYNVDVQYVAIGRSTEVADFMQMIAAGSAPDIIFHYDMPQAVIYYGEAAMQDLDYDEIAFYAPTYWANMEETIKKYGVIDGHQCFMFAERNPINYNYVTLVRKDWCDACGVALPESLEDQNAMAKAWTEKGYGKLGGSLVTKSFTMDYPFRGESVDSTELALYSDLNVAPFTWESTKKFIANLNYEYNNGLIDPEFYLKEEDTDIKGAFLSGKTGTYGFYISSSTDVITSLLANDPKAEVACGSVNMGVPAGSHPWYYKYPSYGMIMGINSKSSAEQRAAVYMFLDWMSQPANLFYFQNGVEGTDYTLDENGVAHATGDTASASVRSANNNKDYWCLVQEIVHYDTEEKTYAYQMAQLAPAGYEYLVEDNYKQHLDVDDKYGLINAIYTVSIAASTDYKDTLTEDWKSFYVDCATSSEADWEAKYTSYCDDYMADGYQAIVDEKQAAIDAGNVLIVE